MFLTPCNAVAFEALISQWEDEKKMKEVPKPKIICGIGKLNEDIPRKKKKNRMPRSLVMERTVSYEYLINNTVKTKKEMPNIRANIIRRIKQLFEWHNIRTGVDEYKTNTHPTHLYEKTADIVLNVASREPLHINSCDVTLYYTRQSWRWPWQPPHYVECLGTVHNAKIIASGIAVVFTGVKRWSKASLLELLSPHPYFIWNQCRYVQTVTMIEETVIILKYCMDYHGYFYRSNPYLRMIDDRITFSPIEGVPEKEIGEHYRNYCSYY